MRSLPAHSLHALLTGTFITCALYRHIYYTRFLPAHSLHALFTGTFITCALLAQLSRNCKHTILYLHILYKTYYKYEHTISILCVKRWKWLTLNLQSNFDYVITSYACTNSNRIFLVPYMNILYYIITWWTNIYVRQEQIHCMYLNLNNIDRLLLYFFVCYKYK